MCANNAQLLAEEHANPKGQGALWQALFFLDAVARVFGLVHVFDDDKETTRLTAQFMEQGLELFRTEAARNRVEWFDKVTGEAAGQQMFVDMLGPQQRQA
jgi:uncharacterized protein with von Willebrand factor type A (vWA) domain